MGAAKDIVEYAGVPRFLFSDFPLGNAAGRPHDPASQAFTLDLALKLLKTAPTARTTVQSPLRWSDDEGRYRCGALTVPLLRPLASRWIAAGRGCDSDAEIDAALDAAIDAAIDADRD